MRTAITSATSTSSWIASTGRIRTTVRSSRGTSTDPRARLYRGGLEQPLGMAVNSTNIFSTEFQAGGAVFSLLIGGGGQSDLISGLNLPEEVAINAAGDAYWTVNGAGAIGRRLNGGSAESLLSGEDQPSGIELDDTHLYWCSEGDREVRRRLLSGGPIETVAMAVQPTGLDLTDDAVIWADFAAGTISMVDK